METFERGPGGSRSSRRSAADLQAVGRGAIKMMWQFLLGHHQHISKLVEQKVIYVLNEGELFLGFYVGNLGHGPTGEAFFVLLLATCATFDMPLERGCSLSDSLRKFALHPLLRQMQVRHLTVKICNRDWHSPRRSAVCIWHLTLAKLTMMAFQILADPSRSSSRAADFGC